MSQGPVSALGGTLINTKGGSREFTMKFMQMQLSIITLQNHLTLILRLTSSATSSMAHMIDRCSLSMSIALNIVCDDGNKNEWINLSAGLYYKLGIRVICWFLVSSRYPNSPKRITSFLMCSHIGSNFQ